MAKQGSWRLMVVKAVAPTLLWRVIIHYPAGCVVFAFGRRCKRWQHSLQHRKSAPTNHWSSILHLINLLYSLYSPFIHHASHHIYWAQMKSLSQRPWVALASGRHHPSSPHGAPPGLPTRQLAASLRENRKLKAAPGDPEWSLKRWGMVPNMNLSLIRHWSYV